MFMFANKQHKENWLIEVRILSKTIEGYGFYFKFIAKGVMFSTQYRIVAEPLLCKHSIIFCVAYERFSQTCRNVGTPLKLKFPLLSSLPNSVIPPLMLITVLIIEMPVLLCLKCILGKFQKSVVFG